MSPRPVGDTVVVVAVEKDDEEATVWRGHPRGQQSVRDLRAISVTPPGNGAHAAEYLPAPPPPCHTAITFVSEMCGNGGARPREGSPAKWAREARRPDGLERWLVSRTLLVSKHQLPFNLTFVLIESVSHKTPPLKGFRLHGFASHSTS